MSEIINDVENAKFSEFSKKVKTSLEDKLRNNPEMIKKAEEFKKQEMMRDAFKEISKEGEE